MSVVVEKELPNGWVIATLNEITIMINSGFPSGRHNKEERGIPHIRPMNISENGIIDLSILNDVGVTSHDLYFFQKK